MSTFRQKKVVNELLANGGSMASAMRKSGYSARTARSPKKLTSSQSFKDEILPVVRQLEAERQAILDRLPIVRNSAKYRDLTYSLDIITKNAQLLQGKKTSNIGVSEYNDLDENELRSIISEEGASKEGTGEEASA